MATAHFTYQSSAVEWSRSAHDYLDWAWRNGREWAVPTSWFPEDAVAGSRWLDDGSEPDPEQLAAFLGEVGDLRRPSQYVVVRGRPILQDFFAPSWTTIGQHPRTTSGTTPLLLIDIDGCLSPYELHDLPEHYREVDFGLKDLPLSRQFTSGLLDLADLYDLDWATTWEDSANAAALRLGWPPLPVVHFDYARPAAGGFDYFKTQTIRDFAGDRSLAWLDDKVTWADATNLVDQHDCLIIRTDILRGIEQRHLDVLASWVGGTRA